MSQRLPITVIIPTYNEEVNLEACLRSLVDWAGDVHIVDSGSTDRTLEIARSYGVGILSHPYDGPRQQWEWALDNVPIRYPWLLMMDADLRVSAQLRESIKSALHDPAHDGYYLRRLQVFRGKPLRHGTLYPRHQLRLVRLAKAHLSGRETLVDEQLYVEGNTSILKGDPVEENQKENDIMFYLEKHLRCAELQARQEAMRRRNQGSHQEGRLFGSVSERKLWLKEHWYVLPLYVRPPLYFLYRYAFRLGFLDGKQGFVYHFLQAYWYRLIVGIRLEEMLRTEESNRGMFDQ